MRAFLAIEIPENFKKMLAEVQGELKPKIPNVRWEKREKLHITLIFLGEAAEDRLSDLEEAVRQGVKGVEPFRLNLSSLGFFSNEKRPRVIWMGVGGDIKALIKLEKQLEEPLYNYGFSFDQKEFHPHITLGRIKSYDYGSVPLQERYRTEDMGKDMSKSGFMVDEVTIMRSTLHPTGSVYTPLSKIFLETS